jgi:hypothetical protein
MMHLTPDTWTVVATSVQPGVWNYEPGVYSKSLIRDAHDEIVLLMHRRVPGGWKLVARIAPGCWRHVKRWRDRHPVQLPEVRKYRA